MALKFRIINTVLRNRRSSNSRSRNKPGSWTAYRPIGARAYTWLFTVVWLVNFGRHLKFLTNISYGPKTSQKACYAPASSRTEHQKGEQHNWKRTETGTAETGTGDFETGTAASAGLGWWREGGGAAGIKISPSSWAMNVSSDSTEDENKWRNVVWTTIFILRAEWVPQAFYTV